MREIFLTVMLSHCLSAVVAQQTYSKTINEQIVRVENNLFGNTIIDGKFYNLQQRMDHYNVPGLSIAVIDNYRIVWAKGYGYADKSENRRITTNTVFEPGSISKSLNAIGILRLAQQGKLNLYQDINQYLISWKFPYDTISKDKKITMAQLLSHTAGVSVYGFPGYERDSILPTIVEILDGKYPAHTQPVRSLNQPGKEFRYSGGGILISQQILTDITKEPYEQFMYNNVFKPLGMAHSFFNQPPPADQRENLATGYEGDGTEVPGKHFVYPEKAAAGLWTTPTDLCKYIIEMQLAYKGQASKVLNYDMAMLHLTPYNNQATAMGTFVMDRNGKKYFFHDAANKGFKGLYIAGLNNGKGVVIFVNSDNGDILLEILNSVARVYNWNGFEEPEHITTVPISSMTALKYVGEYITEGQLSEIKQEDDGLYMWIAGVNSKMYFTSERDFMNIEFPTRKSFTFNSSGAVTGFTRKINDKILASAQRIANVDTIKAAEGQFGAFGRHLLESKDYDKAIRFLSRGVSYEPNDISCQKNLAHCYLFKNDFEKAIKSYQTYLKKNPKENELKNDLKNDFEYFLKAGFDKALINNVKEKLSI